MISSCLIAPLVQPLVGRSQRTGRVTALRRTALATTALSISVLVAIAALNLPDPVRASQQPETEQVRRTAHQKPSIPAKLQLERFLAVLTPRQDRIAPPLEAAPFDHDAVRAARLRQNLDRARDPGPGLGLGRRFDRLFGDIDQTYLLFGSSTHLCALPA